MTIQTKGKLSNNFFGGSGKVNNITVNNNKPVVKQSKPKPVMMGVKGKVGLVFNQRSGLSVEEFSKRYKAGKMEEQTPGVSQRQSLGRWGNFLNAGRRSKGGCGSCGGYK
jgi:hypothetical protein